MRCTLHGGPLNGFVREIGDGNLYREKLGTQFVDSEGPFDRRPVVVVYQRRDWNSPDFDFVVTE